MVCIDESKKGIDNTRASHPQLHMQRNEAADGRQLGKASKRRTWQRKRREPEIFGGWSELPQQPADDNSFKYDPESPVHYLYAKNKLEEEEDSEQEADDQYAESGERINSSN